MHSDTQMMYGSHIDNDTNSERDIFLVSNNHEIGGKV
jgi:hypothetical protein